jgi:hypothetical protein
MKLHDCYTRLGQENLPVWLHACHWTALKSTGTPLSPYGKLEGNAMASFFYVTIYFIT